MTRITELITAVTSNNRLMTTHEPFTDTDRRIAIIVNVIVDLYRENTTKCKGEMLLTLRNWAKLFKHKLSRQELMNVCVQWSKISENV